MNNLRFHSTLPGVLPALLLLMVTAAACRPTPGPAGPTVSPDPEAVVVERIDILTLESFPVQIHVQVQGTLPDACSFIDQAQQTRTGNDFQVTLTLARDPAAKCAPNPTAFEHTVPLEVRGLKAGTYTVTVNGVPGSFELDIDNIAADPPTEAPAATAGESEPGNAPQGAFDQELEAALQNRDAERMRGLMGERFVLGLAGSEGSVLTPDEAVEQLRANYLSPEGELRFEVLDELAPEDVQGMLGPGVSLIQAVRVTGWGAAGDQEAVLFIAQTASGAPYWHGVLIKPAG